MLLGIRHTGIIVKDIERAVEFYIGLGFFIRSKNNEVWNNDLFQIIKLEAPDGNIIELIEGNHLPHIALQVDNISDYDSHPTITKEGFKVTFIKDPDGNIIELVQRV